MHDVPRRSVKVAVALGLAIATVAVYAGLAYAQFTTFDDPMYVAENEHVRQGLTGQGVMWALSSGYAANWHPLTWLSHMLDVQLWGLDPRGHHATSVLIHAANAVLLLTLLDRTTRAFWPSALVSALFALHPTHVESVAWIAERKDVLSTLFAMLTLLEYARYVEQPARAKYALVLVFYALGLMAKPMLVTLPCVMLLLDFWPLERMRVGEFKALVREKLPMFAFAITASVTTFLVQRVGGAMASSERISIAERVSNALVSYLRYIEKTFWPADLAVFYPHPAGLELGLAAVALAVLALVTWFAIRMRARTPFVLFGWLWYVGTLVPVIGLVQVGSQAMADRYSYIPSIGLYVALVWLARDVWHPSMRAAVCAATPVLLALALTTRHQVEFWRNTRALFEHALDVTHDNAVAHQCYGYSLLLDGENDRAIPHLEQALRLWPDFPDAHNNLGTALAAKGQLAQAIEHFHAALRTEPLNAKTHYNLAFALGNAGRFDEAIPEYEESLRIEPDQFTAHGKLAMALGATGRLQEALAHLQSALELRPDGIDERRELAVVLIRLGRVEDAIAQYHALLASTPDDLDALNNIAWIRATHAEAAHRDGAEAVRLAERARDLAPEENAILFDTLAAAYAEAGRFDDAVNACEKAISLARASGNTADAARFEEQLALFRARTPFRNR